jgi:hypothetical protein
LRRTLFLLGICALPPAFALQVHIFGAIERAQPLAYQTQFPFPVIDDRSPGLIASRGWFAAELCAVVLVQIAALWSVTRALTSRGPARAEGILIAIAAAALAAIAFRAPALTSGDMYTYLGYALLGSTAYSPPHAQFPGDFAAINAWWGTPIPPAPYGPLWLAFNAWCLAWASTLSAKVHVLQGIGLAGIVALAALLRACGLKPATCALVLLNPFLYLQFVTNGHNDILPLLLTAAAFAVARKRPFAALPIAIAAGLMKLPFAAIAALAFARSVPPARRIGLAAATAFGALVISLAAGGRPYLNGLSTHAAEGGLGSLPGFVRAPEHVIAAALATAAICAVLLGKRVPGSAALTLPALAAKLFPWYGTWCLPFALDDDALTARLLLCLPVLGFFLESIVDVWGYALFAAEAVVVLAVPGLVAKLRSLGSAS